jgi:hypothetical protein
VIKFHFLLGEKPIQSDSLLNVWLETHVPLYETFSWRMNAIRDGQEDAIDPFQSGVPTTTTDETCATCLCWVGEDHSMMCTATAAEIKNVVFVWEHTEVLQQIPVPSVAAWKVFCTDNWVLHASKANDLCGKECVNL